MDYYVASDAAMHIRRRRAVHTTICLAPRNSNATFTHIDVANSFQRGFFFSFIFLIDINCTGAQSAQSCYENFRWLIYLFQHYTVIASNQLLLGDKIVLCILFKNSLVSWPSITETTLVIRI